MKKNMSWPQLTIMIEFYDIFMCIIEFRKCISLQVFRETSKIEPYQKQKGIHL